jgi:hypothetical protein
MRSNPSLPWHVVDEQAGKKAAWLRWRSEIPACADCVEVRPSAPTITLGANSCEEISRVAMRLRDAELLSFGDPPRGHYLRAIGRGTGSVAPAR